LTQGGKAQASSSLKLDEDELGELGGRVAERGREVGGVEAGGDVRVLGEEGLLLAVGGRIEGPTSFIAQLNFGSTLGDRPSSNGFAGSTPRRI
jgi:hypothetical protein